ncbi:magnesium transporter [Enterobacterales bacterium CwR94]|nr:magnesium transporter [Enterobacterales bacterium CwR94]
MNQRNPLQAWNRLYAIDHQALDDLTRLHHVDLRPPAVAQPGTAMRIRCVRLEAEQIWATEVLWRQGADEQPLYTVECGQRVLQPGQAQERIDAQGLSASSSQTISLMLMHQLLGQAVRVLERIDQGLTVSMQALRVFQLNVGTNRARGAEDLVDVDSHLSTLNVPLSFVLQSLDDLEQAALRLRRVALQGSALAATHIDELIAEIEGAQRRARFTLERQRFHRRATGETVAMSDLNVTKVFSVLWAAFIPGTALINWYGQNFRVMPELSWDGSLWTQLLSVLILTAVPVFMVKQSGALR